MGKQAATEAKQLSNRSFGLIFAVIFLIIALFPVLFGNPIRLWAGMIGACFAVIATILPQLLTPLNNAWVKFGQIMHKITNPILMGLVFFLTVLPTGIIIRLLGKDPMRRKKESSASSYWIQRKNSEQNFNNQF